MNTFKNFVMILSLGLIFGLARQSMADTFTRVLPDYDFDSPELARPEELIGAPSLPYAVVGFEVPAEAKVAAAFGETQRNGDTEIDGVYADIRFVRPTLHLRPTPMFANSERFAIARAVTSLKSTRPTSARLRPTAAGVATLFYMPATF